jgi:hypothetical protein
LQDPLWLIRFPGPQCILHPDQPEGAAGPLEPMFCHVPVSVVVCGYTCLV